MIKPELLAPAGSFESLKAAVENGADAVYLGGRDFSARMHAENFAAEAIEKAIDYAHLRGAKVYVAVNTLIKNQELPQAANFLKAIYEMGADAAIVQDLGLISLAGQLPIELHASTQMTIHNAEGAKLLEWLGFKRVILARELSLEEIKEIKEKVNIELECFVHGALCFSYSGQCLMSSMIGGRSGNRGRCAQPCRKRYSLLNVEGKILCKKYMLSTRDLNTLEHMPDLIKAGISGFKIEGRMKRPEYVAIVTHAYRSAIDRYIENPEKFAVSDEEKHRVRQIFNRGFTSGYFYGKPQQRLMSYDSPDNRGIEIGEVVHYDRPRRYAKILLKDELKREDGIESEGEGAIVKRMEVEGREVESAGAGEIVTVKLDHVVKKGSRVFKTLDSQLIKKAKSSFEHPARKVPVEIKALARISKPFALLISDDDGNIVVETGDSKVDSAISHPLTADTLRPQLDRLGTTIFAPRKISMDLDDKAFVPFSVIAELRRKAVEALERKRIEKSKRKAPDIKLDSGPESPLQPGKPVLAVNAASLEILKSAISGGAELVYIDYRLCGEAIEICRNHNVRLIAHTGRISKSSELEKIKTALPEMEKASGVMVGNLGTLKFFAESNLPIYIDFSLNVFNTFAVNLLSTQFPRIAGIALSPELSLKEIGEIAKRSDLRFECLAHGYLPLIVSEHCIASATLTGKEKCDAPCKRDSFFLRDEAGYTFPLCFDSCRSSVLNSKELCMVMYLPDFVKAGIASLRIETACMPADKAREIVSIYRKNLDRYLKEPEEYKFDPADRAAIEKLTRGLTRGHYFRGVE